MSRTAVRKIAHGAWLLFFSSGSLLVAAYAFTYLGRKEFHPGDPFAWKFALSGIDVPMHFFGAGLALLLAPVQASAWIRRRLPALHRTCGWLSAAAILIGGLGGLSLSFHAFGSWAAGAGFLVLALLWLGATANGIRYAIRGDFARHRRWMSRSMAMTFAAVTLRLILGIGAGALKLPFEAVYVFAAWGSWSINLVVCELWLRWAYWRSHA